MKAKEYFKRLCDDTSTLLLQARINNIHSDIVVEMKDLIKVRHITQDHGKFAVLKEVDNKWRTIVRLCKQAPQVDIDIREDEFLTYIHNNVPEFKKFIQIQEVDENGNIINKENDKPTEIPYFHKVIPLNEITNENITHEILACMYALGGYGQMGMPLSTLKPLAHRISLLRYWKENGIKYEQIEEYNKDPNKFVHEVIKPIMF